MNWLRELGYLRRYIGSGIFNTLIGFIVIFSVMASGFSPMESNVAGYAVGFILGFSFSKKIVFRSNGHFVAEGIRYLLAFFASFILNLLVLNLAIDHLGIHPVTSQIIAATSYTTSMYLLSRLYVFRFEKS
jgi:putative flippase GtrA